MVTIKEKAEEKYPIITGELQTYNEKFVEGANYVLEQVEILLNSQKFVDNPSQELFWLIEQLKK